ncbi:MAG: YggS family pyridoxal phosphate enzyme [Gammaproteobacteria bacterium 39-13]|nr:YggS family pyridoxal phosphate-dependent enzyme [Gammaproteobacteria bacterium]OJV90515.1 MAG: YggS family pyridoxal phosphate enzyme [Gammaproteobacteria bacterium 39-13]
MADLIANFHTVLQRIRAAEQKYNRLSGSVSLLAVSKTHTPEQILTLNDAGQQSFGENYVKEALVKLSAVAQKQLTWHFIGPIQTNKTKDIAQNFSWVHTVCRITEAEHLSRFRASVGEPLNICIQIKLDNNPRKSGVALKDVPALITAIKTLPYLRLRGLMTLPPYVEGFEEQRKYFSLLRALFEQLNQQGETLDTLSMGMTHDLEAAVAEGATIVRIGTGLFGPRKVTTS